MWKNRDWRESMIGGGKSQDKQQIQWFTMQAEIPISSCLFLMVFTDNMIHIVERHIGHGANHVSIGPQIYNSVIFNVGWTQD